MLIRRLTPDDSGPYLHLRRTALQQSPFSFGSSPEDDRVRSIDAVREVLSSADKAVFGAFAAELVGIVGINRDQSVKGSHKCGIWGLYVSPVARRKGVARTLVAEAIRFACSLGGITHVFLSVSDRAPEALELYHSLGFRSWGVQPAALRIGNVDAAEHHMVLTLTEQT